MSKIVKVNLKDQYRALLTDVLPYEVPLWFSNYSMYDKVKEHCSLYSNIFHVNLQNISRRIPFEYIISRGTKKSSRILSIMHPIDQILVCNFYNKYQDIIIYHTSKSKYSLRYPYKVANKFYGKFSKGTKKKDGVENFDEERITSSSFFKYKKYPFLYKFFESYEYHSLEKKYKKMIQLDITKCFPSIYTHSISWAVKTKKIAKSEINNVNFDREFDKLMQNMNYGETNGILVGSEVSRIFSEIILQKIDLNLVSKLSDGNLIFSKHYEFRRYVDDYFVFYNDDIIKEQIILALESCLHEYNLYLNDNKTLLDTRPFATNISLAKHAIKNKISELYSSRYRDNGNGAINDLKYPSSKANKMISDIKMVIANYDIEYSSISTYLFSSISNNLDLFLSRIEKLPEMEDTHLNWLLVDLDVLFFIHSMDMRVRPTDKLARMISTLLVKINKKFKDDWCQLIYKKIFDQVKQAINILIEHSDGRIGLETLNLIIILTMLPPEYKMSCEILKGYILKSLSLKDLSTESIKSVSGNVYLFWMTYMLYIKKHPEYYELNNILTSISESYILQNEDKFQSSEFFMFFFDFMSCPYIDIKIKKKILNQTVSHRISAQNKEFIYDNDFIVPWRDENYIDNSLEKKEFTFPYN